MAYRDAGGKREAPTQASSHARHVPPPAPAGLLSTLAFANFAIGIGAFVVIGVLTPIAEGLVLTHAEAGLVMSIYAIAYAIGSPLAITATGRLDRESVLLIGTGTFLVAAILCALAPNAEVLLGARMLGALGAGMVTPVAAAIAAASAAPERRGKALSFVMLGLTLAQVAGIPVGSFLGYTAGWRATFWMVAAITALALLGIAWRVPRLRTPVTTLRVLGRTLASPVLMPAILVTASMMGAVWTLFTYVAPLLEDRMGYGRDGVTMILVDFGAGAVIGNMLGGWLSDRIGPRALAHPHDSRRRHPAAGLLAAADAVLGARRAVVRLGRRRLGLHGAAAEPTRGARPGEPERHPLAQRLRDLCRRRDRLGCRRRHRRRAGRAGARLDLRPRDARRARACPAHAMAGTPPRTRSGGVLRAESYAVQAT